MHCAKTVSLIILLSAASIRPSAQGSRSVSLSQNLRTVNTYEFVEVTLTVSETAVANPFSDAELVGKFGTKGGLDKHVIGFCDSDDGSVFRIRLMPCDPGEHVYRLTYREKGGFSKDFEGAFRARKSQNKGMIRVDPAAPFHFIWEGSGEHYLYNGTTAYHLLSWTNDNRMLRCIDRIASTGCNRIRFLNYGRASDNEWGEGMVQSRDFVWTLSPWPAKYPNRQLKEGSPGFDHTRFNLAHWRKCERALMRMRERNVVGSVIMLMDRGINDAPAAGSELERRYYRYAVARYGAFSNVMWDLGNEHNEYRKPEWAGEIGRFVKKWDGYGHLISAHGHATFPYDVEEWAGFAIYQKWGDGQNEFMLAQRADAAAKGRLIPQVNEEYGYERHKDSGQDEVRRRAWEIAMAGCYQTTGEWKGWQHGEAAPGSKILTWTGHMREFFEDNLPWWDMKPANELIITGNAYGLAAEGKAYAVYMPKSGRISVRLAEGSYRARWFNPRSAGYVTVPGRVPGGTWQSPESPDGGDWALLIKMEGNQSAVVSPRNRYPQINRSKAFLNRPEMGGL